MKIVMIILIVSALLLSGCATGQIVKEADAVKIGAIVPLTGWGAYWGLPAVDGMKIAVEEVNARGLLNSRLRLVVEDSKASGKEAATAAQKLVNVDGVDAAIVEFAPPALAAAPVLEAAKVPFVYDAFPKSIVQNNTYAFKSFLDPAVGCRRMVEHAKEKNMYKKIGAVLAQQEYSHLCLEGAKEIEPDIETYWYNFGNTDFRTTLAKASRDGADTVLIIGWANEFVPFFRQREELGYEFNVLCGSGSECVGDDVVNAVGGATLKGVVAFDYADVSDTAFARKYMQRNNNATEADLVAAAHGYEAVMVIAGAMEQCYEITGSCVRDKMSVLKKYPSALKSRGFRERVLQIRTEVYMHDGESIVEAK